MGPKEKSTSVVLVGDIALVFIILYYYTLGVRRPELARRREHGRNGTKSDRAMCACEVCEAVVALWVVKKAYQWKEIERDDITLCIEGGRERERERDREVVVVALGVTHLLVRRMFVFFFQF
jgi:hypothetical protein